MMSKDSKTDSYSDQRHMGRVLGSKSPSGVVRKGVDVEKLISIDNGALRIQPLAKAGWGRQGIAYGPYTRANGLAFSVFVLNGHNTSQAENILQGLRVRLLNWAIGLPKPERVRWILLQRFFSWMRSDQKKRIVRKIQCWFGNTPKRFQPPKIDENLAVGWFPREVPSNPLAEGNNFIIHATGPENGELWTRVAGNTLSAFKGLQNVPVYYIVILRQQGAAYYAASLPNTHGLAAYPNMRPVAIDPFNEDATVYAGLYQSVLGQIGFMVDTRVYGAHVEQIPGLATWYGTAQAADRLIREGELQGSQGEVGGIWSVNQGSYELTANGARSKQKDSLAVLDLEVETGLIHVIIATNEQVTPSSLIWRYADESNYWIITIAVDKCQLQIQENGCWETVAVSDEWYLAANTLNSIQILDDGDTFGLYLNGKLVFNTWFTDNRLKKATGVGISSSEANENLYFRSFEAHPRTVPIPNALDLGSPWIKEGKEALVMDNFQGETQELAGKTSSFGGKVWEKEMGRGIIELTGHGSAKVRANLQNPNPDRTAYTVAWDNPNFADVQVDITPPGTQRGQGEEGRGGLIFWQDPGNYIIINNWLNNNYGGASVSSFFTINGFEDLYDAVWTNIGSRISWGITHTFRVVFDGMNYTVLINNEPVLYRKLTDVYPNTKGFAINKIGIVANWEWGNDTGSVFNNFVAKV